MWFVHLRVNDADSYRKNREKLRMLLIIVVTALRDFVIIGHCSIGCVLQNTSLARCSLASLTDDSHDPEDNE